MSKIVILAEDGRSVRYIANLLNLAKSTVHDALRRYQNTGQYTRRPGSGRKRILNERDERFLTLSVLRERSLTSNVLAGRLVAARGTEISSRSVRRVLKENGLTSRKQVQCPLLTPANKTARLRFATEHRNWTIHQWSTVMFSDESRFSLRSPDGRERVWRRVGERFASCCIAPKTPFGGGSVMVWAGISFYGRTELVVIERGSMTADRYIRECLEDHVVPYAPFVGDQFLFMHDNARPHVAQVVTQYLENVEIPRLDWPARSPDLNPIEHLWDTLTKHAKCIRPLPETTQEQRMRLIEKWDQIPQEIIQHLIESMPRRMEAVIRSRGGNTRY